MRVGFISSPLRTLVSGVPREAERGPERNIPAALLLHKANYLLYTVSREGVRRLPMYNQEALLLMAFHSQLGKANYQCYTVNPFTAELNSI